MKLFFPLLAPLAFLFIVSSCNEAGDDDTPGMQSSKNAAPGPKTDGRQEKLVPESRNHESEGQGQ
ncbi:hypothetical protein [Luteolibacter luteus]|uniref:Lipoprotein n=1 Tax=Luteolibacter luteus TaxID=2728835 RepID=A0A858RGS3_9BACT|nr:hypothetical protein [Luteolibacter luteus]QJE95754.1 hypothetical protein HHL09_08135 [Luteolibacter luteus]